MNSSGTSLAMLLVGTVAFFAGALLAHMLPPATARLLTAENAAWTQAIVSVIAIIAAFRGIHLQGRWLRREAGKARQFQIRSQLESVLAVAEAAGERANIIDTAFSQPTQLAISSARMNTFHPAMLENMIASLTDIPLHTAGSRDVVLELLKLREQLRFLSDSIISYDEDHVRIAETAANEHLLQLSEEELSGRRLERERSWKIMAANVRGQVGYVSGIYSSLSKAIATAIHNSEQISEMG